MLLGNTPQNIWLPKFFRCSLTSLTLPRAQPIVPLVTILATHSETCLKRNLGKKKKNVLSRILLVQGIRNSEVQNLKYLCETEPPCKRKKVSVACYSVVGRFHCVPSEDSAVHVLNQAQRYEEMWKRKYICKLFFTSALNATSRSGRNAPADKALDTGSLAGEWTPQSVWTLWRSENLSIPRGNRTPITLPPRPSL